MLQFFKNCFSFFRKQILRLKYCPYTVFSSKLGFFCWIWNKTSSTNTRFPVLRQKTSLILKELRNCILRTICVWSSFCSIWVCISLQILPILLQNYSSCVFFGSLSILYLEFWCHLNKTSWHLYKSMLK